MKTSGAALGGACRCRMRLDGSRRQHAANPFKVANDDACPSSAPTEVFPVRRIYCIGRNYAAHAREMGSDPTREPPFFFQKPTDAIQFVAPGTVGRPSVSAADEELPLRDRTGRRAEERRPQHPDRRRAGPRLRLRDRARHDAPRPAARHGRPEEAVGDRQELRPLRADRADPSGRDQVGPFHQGRDLAQGERPGEAGAPTSSYMIWSRGRADRQLSQAFELMAGDIIYSGTPENVGPVVRGDLMRATSTGCRTCRCASSERCVSRMASRGQGGLVYSTEAGGSTCPACRQPIAQCACKDAAAPPAGDGIVRVSRETAGRGGKAVTIVRGLALDATALSAMAKQLKAVCGAGGTVKDDAVEIQGDHCERVIDALRKQGRIVKRAGG